jgi:hypothetical protein
MKERKVSRAHAITMAHFKFGRIRLYRFTTERLVEINDKLKVLIIILFVIG